MGELPTKLAILRTALARHDLAAVRLRGVDWFAWATGGRSSVVATTAETGVAEVLVGRQGAWIVTDAIEAPRIRDEELAEGFAVLDHPWAEPGVREDRIRGVCPGEIASDRPGPGERPLPLELPLARYALLPAEVARLRTLGHDTAVATTEALLRADPDWSELDLAGAVAESLWSLGIVPGVILVAGERRLPLYRHPVPTDAALDGAAMLVVCGRRGGLWANLTRFVYFRPLSRMERAAHDAVATVEAAALSMSSPGRTLGDVYEGMAAAYAHLGRGGEEGAHHQGGLTGYLPREVIAMPHTRVALPQTCAVAWNPTVPGAKIEDTVLVSVAGQEVLTVDPRWPVTLVGGLARPDVMVR